ncbi:MAG: DUF6382 domain-containing protein [Clostridia bacterium]|nr:DUF6382 domain-containing protein [Clostridia bacterium]
MWENNEFKMYLNDLEIPEFEKVMLTSGECDFLIPMIFIGEESEQVAYYDCSGFVPLKRYSVETAEDAFFIIENVLVIVGGLTDYLITPARIKLDRDTVFFNTDTGEIKIAYVPAGENTTDLKRNLLNLIAQLKMDINDGHGDFLDRFARIIHYGNYHIDELLNRLGVLKRELYSQTISSS